MTNLCKNASTDITGYNSLIMSSSEPKEDTTTNTSSDIQQLISYVKNLIRGKSESFENIGSSLGETITLQTVLDDLAHSPESHYIPLIDLSNSDYGVQPSRPYVLPDDPLIQIYFASLGFVGLYVLYRFMEKSHI